MSIEEFLTRKYFNMHKELHGEDDYNRKYVIRDIIGELSDNITEPNE